jgi:hypothetical protein
MLAYRPCSVDSMQGTHYPTDRAAMQSHRLPPEHRLRCRTSSGSTHEQVREPTQAVPEAILISYIHPIHSTATSRTIRRPMR